MKLRSVAKQSRQSKVKLGEGEGVHMAESLLPIKTKKTKQTFLF